MKVFLNPGHMVGVDSGAVNGSFTEASIVQKIGEKVQEYLQEASVEVVLLQSDNLTGESEGFPCVVDEANASGADVFVSIHMNAAENKEATGTEILVHHKGSLAEFVAKDVLSQLDWEYRSLDSDWINRGIKERPDLAVLKYTNMPAVLIECAFISNDDDLRLTICHINDIASGIARGMTDYELQCQNENE